MRALNKIKQSQKTVRAALFWCRKKEEGRI
jgi:hypothetical protein